MTDRTAEVGAPVDPMADARFREDLLKVAREVVRQVTQGGAHRQAGTAAAVVLRGGLDDLERCLQADYPAGGSERQWRSFRKAFPPALDRIRRIVESTGVPEQDRDRTLNAAVLFVLGWVRRLGQINESSRRDGRRPRPGRR